MKFARRRVALYFSILASLACSSAGTLPEVGHDSVGGAGGSFGGAPGPVAGATAEDGGSGSGASGATAIRGGAPGAGVAGGLGDRGGAGGVAGVGSGSAGMPNGPGGAGGSMGGAPYTGPTASATISVARGTTVGRLAPNYAGFSFEKSHLTDNFFTGTNAPLIALFKLLGSGGSLRLGGHDVDSRHWRATATPAAAGQTSTYVGTADVDALAAFLDATGWKVIYGLNLQSETTADDDVAEATYVSQKTGANLHSFEIGNEWGSNLEPRWETFAAAIKSAVPSAREAGPGACCGTGFPLSFAKTEAGKVTLLTYHHYVGAAASANATAATLLGPDNGLISDTKALAAAAAVNNIPEGFRWGEINSFSGHGKAGVSNAYVSALWGIDDMLVSAQNGATGVNYHGGGQNMDGNNCPNGPSSCGLPFYYSPITESNSQVTGAAPLFYAMLFISRAGTGAMFKTSGSTGGLNVSSYAIGQADGSTNIVLLNKDTTVGLSARVDVGAAVVSATAIYLQGPSLSATTGVTLAGSGISSTGVWAPKPAYALTAEGNVVTVIVPPASAALIHSQ